MQRALVLGLVVATAACSGPPAAADGVELVPISGRHRFRRPLFFVQPPDGTDRAMVVEQYGRIHVHRFDGTLGPGRVFLDLADVRTRNNEEGLLGMAFDPDHATNGFFYVYYSASDPQRIVVSRWRVSDDPDVADPSSEQVLLEVEQPWGNHNGGAIAFGPDGYLYLGIGDGGAAGDPRGNGQNLSTLLGSIVRIDVGRAEGGRPYAIPPDNPFVGRPGARPEIYAYGLRNPWRFSFDRRLGTLFAGDVGQDRQEEIDVIVAGGNYGWRAFEGDRVFDRRGRLAREDAIFPIATYGRGEGKSVTGGHVYRGRDVPALAGRYVYGDYESGRIWSLVHDERGARDVKVVLDSRLEIASFAEDRAGELYICAFDGRIYRFAGGPGRPEEPALPDTLAATGIAQAAAVPYSVNVALHSDGADKDRSFVLPEGGRIGYAAGGAWSFPDGTTLVKTFRFGERKIETRLLVRRGGRWSGVTYRWNEAGTAARRLDGALTETIVDGGRRRTWSYPSPSECLDCHTEAAGFVLGLRTLQMNRDGQIEGLVRAGRLDRDPGDPSTWPAFPTGPDAPVAGRARAYLDVNCAMCHQPGGPGNATIDLRHDTPLDRSGLLGAPGQGDLGLAGARIVAPGDPDRSILLARMRRRGPGQMPNLATHAVDEEACRLIADWIEAMR